ncbi:M14 family metallopeptidase [Chitinophaga nivalis]|uniref:M14 family metallopeptidase n=1 Tax=Chitinophaga nivalis TaxID=2991709 RepID=A0ABT3IQU3_9BACT|nr:M14 family metallopeptidase [Chitinophaga nivalis]MCW3464064.1 M14 family metallopeptidase [Chitinophaga nivalis]MCW3486246.1 M14 family metallopeptidase [Chitinophaga nivalis]
MRRLILLAFLSLGFSRMHAQVPTPDQFLGYPLGSQFTPHYKVVDYFKTVAASVKNVKLEQYGSTYEGRPLMMAVVASPENFSRLDDIRQRSLAMSNAKDNGNGSQPVVVWLSYNVHGNEAVSTEASMKTLYELVNNGNAQTQQWLQHAVVILDPCLNPDGHDRYVNFYNATRGKQPNVYRYSREHHEPWPGGRPNHYYFDLNRDWAWQTQQESQQRVAKYNQWMPQIHVDFHEQEIEAPYYFAPAAEPFHDAITPWQRQLQVMIGKNNAKYFDEQGWLYFTKERFDLFYPSYGDTYPMYNGAIGMTFEQGGSGRAGVAVKKRDGDTLTLTDRIAHHFTTGMSTIEVAAQNAGKIISEYVQYFDRAKKDPQGGYKSYVIKAAGNTEKLNTLAELLRKNNIAFGFGTSTGSSSGFNYFTGKTENFTIDKEDLVINAYQPHSNMLRVLFEPVSHLTDSVTYDITAWALPYAYGLPAYAVKQPLTPAADAPAVRNNTPLVAQHPYAYLAKWNSLRDVKFLAALLQQDIKVRFTEVPFTVGSKDFPAGTLVITRAGNTAKGAAFDQFITSQANRFKISLDAVSSGFVDKGMDFGSDKIRYIKAPRVVLLMGDEVSSLGTGEIWHFFEQQLDFPLTVVNERNLDEVNLEETDVVILPDGYYRSLSEKASADRLKSWVNNGGKLIALEGAAAQLTEGEWGIKLKKEEDNKAAKDKAAQESPYEALKPYANRERESVKQFIPGAIYKVQLDETHPLAFGYPAFYYTLKQDSRLYDFIDNDGWNVGVLKKDSYLSGFVGTETRKQLKDGLIFGVKDMGHGEIVIMADNPLFRSFWENGKLLFSNAVFLVGQ